jgi:imidazolonepropionase-like amidohydrolase
MPEGLWDAHTHLTWWGPDALDSLVKYGIVGVRDLGSDAYTLAKWRDEIARGTRRGPLILFAGGQIDGPKESTKWRTIVTTEAQARRAVDSLADLGVSFVKTHNKITPELLFVVVRQARARGLRVAAHLPEGVTAWVAADSGVGSLEHMAESILVSPIWANYAKTLREAAEWWLSPAGDTMIAHLARTGVAVTPTLAAYQEWVREKGVPETTRASRQRALDLQMQLTGRFYRAGLPILAGSDFADKDWTVTPGASLLEEMRLLEASGLTPQDARRAASTNIIEWIRQRP